ncbi:Putative uncharacterized protein ymcC [Thermobacillus xylanilyticus]|jgi:hypothetical protein|uniref:Uncharacterized protein n=3 Tax=Thermobacillus TaxID=76632 RepID=L0EEV1_THECK|nr:MULTISPECIES: hypothetical protein [Thermobacillus]AGA57675.1 hypothetical protein Theco_1536 [Thermobacillus composti KWC4]CAG5085149.1 Putative uncharacterized protein ymcC [Thermobacillus xylanilyticus]
MIAAMIIACEIGFWLFVLAGLACRYLIGMRRLGGVLLASTILVDVALLIFTTIDIRNGATAGFFHGLAAVYIGVSIVFGKQMIRWADGKFAHRFAGGPAPAPKPKYGAAHARYERIMWLKHLLAWMIGSAILIGLVLYIDNIDRSRELLNMIGKWAIVLAIDFLISFSYTIWPRKEKTVNG